MSSRQLSVHISANRINLCKKVNNTPLWIRWKPEKDKSGRLFLEFDQLYAEQKCAVFPMTGFQLPPEHTREPLAINFTQNT